MYICIHVYRPIYMYIYIHVYRPIHMYFYISVYGQYTCIFIYRGIITKPTKLIPSDR